MKFFITLIAAICFKDPYADTGVTGFTLTTNNSPATATYGNNAFELTFTYTLGSGELTPTFFWSRKRSDESNFVQIASLFSPNTFNASFLDTALENRATLTSPTPENGYTGTLRFTEILCNDEATYKIVSTYTTSTGSQTTEREVVLEIRTIATFQNGVALAFSPNANLQEGQPVTFTCDEDVGKNPEGTFNWFRYSSAQTTGGHNITNLAITGDPVSSPSTCSYRRTATYTHILTKDDNGFMVRCALQQLTIGTETGNGVRQTDPIPVYYKSTVQSISKTPSRQKYVVGESVMLTCSGQGNPSPSVWWVSMDGTVVQSSQLQLSNLQLSDNHTYTCIVQNNYNGVNYTDSMNITLDIVTTVIALYSSQPTGPTDLVNSGVTFICETKECMKPAPTLTWYYMDGDNKIVYRSSTSGIISSSCTSGNKYSSTLSLPRYTTFPGNVPKTTKFQCGMNHLSLSREVYSALSADVTFAETPAGKQMDNCVAGTTGGFVGGIAVGAAIVLAVLYCRRRIRKKHRDKRADAPRTHNRNHEGETNENASIEYINMAPNTGSPTPEGLYQDLDRTQADTSPYQALNENGLFH